jgi:Zn-dependent M28 family amino/carboxypeptidase
MKIMFDFRSKIHILSLCFFLFSLGTKAQQLDTAQLMKDLKVLSADDMQGRLAGSAGGEKARNYLIDRFRQVPLLSFPEGYEQYFNFTTFRTNQRVDNCANLIGYIPGEIEDVIVISCHYDHVGQREDKIYNGADDNASGTAALLAMADYFSKNKPRHTLIFAAFDAEEQGKKGSIYFISKPPEGVRKGLIRMNINMDMLSISDKNELWASGTYHNPFLKPMLEEVTLPEGLSLQFGHDRPEQGIDDWTNASDHGPFYKEGIPHIYFGVEDHEHYHQSTDTFDNIQPEFYQKAVLTVLRSVIRLDQADLFMRR